MRSNLLLLSGILIMVSAVSNRGSANDSTLITPAIIPQVQSLKMKSGTFIISSDTEVQSSSDTGNNADILRKYLENIITPESLTATPSENLHNRISLQIDKSLLQQYGREAYRLNISSDEIKITGASPAGVFYGIQTLRQLLPPSTLSRMDKKSRQKSYKIPCMQILDYPRFQWRALMIDSGRHYFPVADIKKILDVMALQKMNKMHWHLTEDQGWRIEIKKYPKLTEIGSIRSESPMRGNREKGDGKQYGPYFYTQEQVRDIVKYAKERYITIVPEIELPGHSIAALAAYPSLGCTGGPYKVRTTWGVEPNIYCAGKEETFTFLEDVLTEIMDLFPSEFIHIGGDEAPKKIWSQCQKCQARMKKEGLKNENELQSYFIQRIDKFLTSHGRRLIGWDEILAGGLAPGAAVMSWRGEKGGIKAAKMGHDVVMTPDSYCYLDYAESKNPGEPESIGGFLPLYKVYRYNPVPERLTKIEAKHILGVQGNLWGEYIWTPEELEYKAFPRGCAIAEVGWTYPEHKEYNDFIKRLQVHLNRLKAMNVTYRPLDSKQ